MKHRDDPIDVNILTHKPMDWDSIVDLPPDIIKAGNFTQYNFTELWTNTVSQSNARSDLCCVDFDIIIDEAWIVVIDDVVGPGFGDKYLVYTGGYQYVRDIGRLT